MSFPTFLAGPNNYLVIQTNGNIGIGTTNPSTSLHVSGSSIFINSVTSGTVYHNGFMMNNSSCSSYLNDGTLYIAGVNDSNHILRYSGSNTTSSSYGINCDGPVLHGNNGTLLGTTKGGKKNIITCQGDTTTGGMYVNGILTVNSINVNSSGNYQMASGLIGSGTQTGNVSFPFTFTNTPIVVLTENSNSTNETFGATTYNISTTGFSYVKNFAFTSLGGGGGSTSEQCFWLAMG